MSAFDQCSEELTVSIIIVNYNVKFFLEQCLHSVRCAGTRMATQVIVVDNASTDGSLPYLQPRFPEVTFIASPCNLGFAKACNTGLQQATGQYILFLNPDTLLAEDTLEVCVQFFEQHRDAGAVGVRMIDGAGHFLKESKRAFPAPFTSLFKLAGLSRLFPHSKVFSRYHLGHLDARKNHEVDVLAGAFMMLKSEVLEKVGAFDEAFFMYGEDVDLSYRVQKAGYKNYYVAQTEIIHFKGESTRRGSLNYVRMFYSAMSTFVKKHYGGSKALVFNVAIHFAIWLRALLAALSKFIRWVGLPVIDAVLILFSFWLAKEIWMVTVKLHINYPDDLLLISLPAFTLVYMAVAYYAGLYDRQYKPGNLVRSTLIATLVLLALYALLPEHYRFSRGIVVLGALLAFIGIKLLRSALVKAKVLHPVVPKTGKPSVLVAAGKNEYEELKKLLQRNSLHTTLIGRLSVNGTREDAIAHWSEAGSITTALNAKELIVCTGSLTYKNAIQFIQQMPNSLRLRFHAAGSCSIVGSDSSSSSGLSISTEASFNLAKPVYRRFKRLADVCFSFVFLLFFPLHFLLVKHPLYLLANAVQVLAGKKTWIGYIKEEKGLPPLRQAVLASNGLTPRAAQQLTTENYGMIDFWYARNYEPVQDVKLILKSYRHLGVQQD